MTPAVQRYVELLEAKLLERAVAGGALSQEQEGAYVEEFDLLWRGMTADEQETVEGRLAAPPAAPSAPDVLDFIDVEVAGGHVPRRSVRHHR